MKKLASLLTLSLLLVGGMARAEPKKLVVHYPLDGDASDALGSNDGTVFGATACADRFGNPGGAMCFAGDAKSLLAGGPGRDCQGDYIEIPFDPALKSLEKGSISVWFKTANPAYDDTFPIVFFGANHDAVGCYQGSSDDGPFGMPPGWTPWAPSIPPPWFADGGETPSIIIEIGHSTVPNRDKYPVDGNGVYYTTILDGFSAPMGPWAPGTGARPPITAEPWTWHDVTQCFDTGWYVPAQEWHHFVSVVSDTGNTGYLDGVELTDRHYNFSLEGAATEEEFQSEGHLTHVFFADLADTTIDGTPRSYTFTIGKGNVGPFYETFFEGAIDDVKVFNYPLKASQVHDLYTQGDQGQDTQ